MKHSTLNPCAGWKAIKETLISPGWRPATPAREGDKRNSRAQKGYHPPVPQMEASARVSRQAEVLVHICCQEGCADPREPGTESSCLCFLRAEPKREWVRQEPGRQLEKGSPRCSNEAIRASEAPPSEPEGLGSPRPHPLI